MCLYPKIIKNKKYLPNKKNGGHVPYCQDERVKWVAVGCGKCIECRKMKAREWQTRLNEEIKNSENEKALFVTLTFDKEHLEELKATVKWPVGNAIAAKGVRLFLERVRKETKKSLKHWLITEMGKNGTQRIHLHGIIWTNKSREWLQNKWHYGYIYVGDYVNIRTINYIIKYITKVDNEHKEFRGQILCSAGIGSKYIGSYNQSQNRYNGTETKEYYRLPNGHKISLPIYYRNKTWSEDEREKLWINKLNKQEIYVLGNKIDISTDEGLREYEKALKGAREYNKRLGYGGEREGNEERDYNITLRKINAPKNREEAAIKALKKLKKGG